MGWDAGAVRTGSGAVRRKMRTTALSADSVRCEETVGMQEVGPPPRSACRRRGGRNEGRTESAGNDAGDKTEIETRGRPAASENGNDRTIAGTGVSAILNERKNRCTNFWSLSEAPMSCCCSW